jgi:hypothetical protein
MWSIWSLLAVRVAVMRHLAVAAVVEAVLVDCLLVLLV